MKFWRKRRGYSVASLALIVAFRVGVSHSVAGTTSVKFLEGKKVAVAVFAQNKQAEPVIRTAQSRMEEILADNEIAVLDEEKTRELKDVFKTLEDPGAFVTAETFVENSKKFDIHGLVGVYLSAEVVPGLADYYSATAHADIRFVDNQTARVRTLSTPPMGIRGSPTSDGLTRNSAAINAVQRAVDSACSLTGFQIAEWTRAKSVDLDLVGPFPYAGDRLVLPEPQNERALWDLAALENQTWRKEEVTCTARSEGGSLAVIAGYIKDTDFRRRPQRLYGSRVHIVDTNTKKAKLILDCSPVEKKIREESNTKKVLACIFVKNWRYLCVATGNYLFMWDVEKGREICKLPLCDEPMGMSISSDGTGSSILIQTRKGILKYRVVRVKH